MRQFIKRVLLYCDVDEALKQENLLGGMRSWNNSLTYPVSLDGFVGPVNVEQHHVVPLTGHKLLAGRQGLLPLSNTSNIDVLY